MSCEEMNHLKWEVNVVFADDQFNAFVLPHGQIFVFTGLLKVISNDHELATVLGHEIAHAILQNGILLYLPYSRKLELEADKVGMYFATKACFDVRESPKFWQRMDQCLKLAEDGDVDIEWLSTHPSHDSRAKKLKEMVPEAMELRRLCNCPQIDAIPMVSGSPRPHSLTPAKLAGIKQQQHNEKE